MAKAPKLGNIYLVVYNDHFRTPTWVAKNDPDALSPVVLKAIGKLVAITPLQFNLEHATQDDRGVNSISGVMRSCVTKMFDLGPDPSTEEK